MALFNSLVVNSSCCVGVHLVVPDCLRRLRSRVYKCRTGLECRAVSAFCTRCLFRLRHCWPTPFRYRTQNAGSNKQGFLFRSKRVTGILAHFGWVTMSVHVPVTVLMFQSLPRTFVSHTTIGTLLWAGFYVWPGEEEPVGIPSRNKGLGIAWDL